MISNIAHKIMADFGLDKCQLEVGLVTDHPEGYKVKIIDGQYWGTYGISNFWYWKKVYKNGRLSKKTYNGYGWK